MIEEGDEFMGEGLGGVGVVRMGLGLGECKERIEKEERLVWGVFEIWVIGYVRGKISL
ncbi:hypothetical protein [Cytobacillus oceanisediminis]|uniref:hypothetical protein n=1 Tax=Cytobacillus oceanisediminis TaxID=665099 RepID=UPI0016426AB0|nr:hypothetical protein [Cytobacillus oceanisediminis]